MKLWKWAIVPLIVVAGLLGYALMPRQPAPDVKPAAANPPAPAPSHPVSNETLAADLASTSDQQRQAAEQFLAAFPYQKRSVLETMQQETADPRIKQLLADRLKEIQRLLALNPPPISLHVKEATLDQVIGMLNEEMGTAMRCTKDTPPVYALDATDKPFWEIMMALEKQHGYSINVHDVIIVADYPADRLGYGDAQISGPFLLHASEETMPMIRMPTLDLALQLQVDPRMTATHITCDIAISGPATSGPRSGYTPLPPTLHGDGTEGGFNQGLLHQWPATTGDRTRDLDTVSVSAVFTLIVPDLIVKVPDVDQHVGTQTPVGDAQVKVANFTAEGRTASLALLVTPPEKAKFMQFRVIDRIGQIKWRQMGSAATTPGYLTGDIPDSAGAPFSLEVRLEDSVVEKPVTFTPMKVPIPRHP